MYPFSKQYSMAAAVAPNKTALSAPLTANSPKRYQSRYPNGAPPATKKKVKESKKDALEALQINQKHTEGHDFAFVYNNFILTI